MASMKNNSIKHHADAIYLRQLQCYNTTETTTMVPQYQKFSWNPNMLQAFVWVILLKSRSTMEEFDLRFI